jgi:hypothetical protein
MAIEASIPDVIVDVSNEEATADSAPDVREAGVEAEASTIPETGPDGDTGTTDFSLCGRVTSVYDNLGETMVGTTLMVMGTSSGPNPAALTFAWSASPSNAGTFGPPSGAGANPSALFTCLQPGMVTITLTVSDGVVPDAAPSCSDVDHQSLPVVCDPAPDAG